MRHQQQGHSTKPVLAAHTFGKKCREQKHIARKTPYYGSVRFDSLSEISCAMALERYVPGWEIVEGKTYQVPIGHRKTADFRVNGAIVEYHPIRLVHEMYKPAYTALAISLRKTSKAIRRQIRTALKADKIQEYRRKRHWTMRQHPDPEIRDAKLIICESPKQFYQKVIKKFGEGDIPKLKDFERMFRLRKFE